MDNKLLEIDNLAREVFVADNSRLPRDEALAEWVVEYNWRAKDSYAYSIAEGLLPRVILAKKAWDDGALRASLSLGHGGHNAENPYK